MTLLAPARAPRAEPSRTDADEVDPAGAAPTGARGTALREASPAAACLVLALLLWVFAVRATDPTAVGDYGLLPLLPPAFAGAVLLVVGGLALELRRRRPRPWLFGAHLVALVLLLHATLPLLLEQPQYAWVYKHIGVIEAIRAHGSVASDVDVYQLWPAFFAAVALLCDLAGVGPLSFAEWAPVVFNLVDALLLLAVCRALRPRDERVPYVAVALFVGADWVGQDYLAPQAFAFTLSLGLQLVLVRFLPGHRRTRLPRLPWRRRPRDVQEQPGAEGASPPPRRLALVAVWGLFAVVVASHQLTPYVVLLGAGALVVLDAVRPRWLVGVLAATALLYLAPRLSFVSGHFSVFSGLDVFSNTRTNVRSYGGDGRRFTSAVVRGLTLVVWSAAAASVWRLRRWPGVAVPAALFAAPFGIVLLGSYGGEAVFRVYLASLPWAAFLVAAAVCELRVRPALRTAGAVAALVAVVFACLQGLFGQLRVNRVSTAEVRASQFLYRHAPPGSVLALASYTFPTRLAADYDALMSSTTQADPHLLETPVFDGQVLGERSLPRVEDLVRSYGGTRSFLVLSRSEREFAHYFGLVPDGSLESLERTLRTAPGWTEYYRNEDVTVFEFHENGRTRA